MFGFFVTHDDVCQAFPTVVIQTESVGCGEWEGYIGSVVNMLWTFNLAKFITDGRVGNKDVKERGSREQGGIRILDPANDLPCSNQLSC